MSVEEYARGLVSRICGHFKIPPPRVKYDPRRCRGHIACYANGTIYFATPDAVNETVILHELLHYALDVGYPTYTCDVCGSPIIMRNRKAECYVCHEKYVVAEDKNYPGGSLGDVVFGIIIGTFFIAPFIYVPIIRSWAVRKISEKLAVAKSKVEEALKK